MPLVYSHNPIKHCTLQNGFIEQIKEGERRKLKRIFVEEKTGGMSRNSKTRVLKDDEIFSSSCTSNASTSTAWTAENDRRQQIRQHSEMKKQERISRRNVGIGKGIGNRKGVSLMPMGQRPRVQPVIGKRGRHEYTRRNSGAIENVVRRLKSEGILQGGARVISSNNHYQALSHRKATVRQQQERTSREARPQNVPKRRKVESRLDYWKRYFSSPDAYISPSTLSETLSQFDDFPWRINRDPEDAETVQGAPRLSERCVALIRQQLHSGKLFDIRFVPPDVAFGLLNGNVSLETLKRYEEEYPEVVDVYEAVWARYCKKEFRTEDRVEILRKIGYGKEQEMTDGEDDGDEQSVEFLGRWRAVYEVAQERKIGRMEKAKMGLQKRYADIEEQKRKRQLSTKLIAPPKRMGRVRKGWSVQGSESGVGRPLQRLKMEMKRGKFGY